MKKVSIVLPTYNRAKVLTRAIDSVLAQTYQDWELIVVNDASTDETEELLRRYEAKDHRIRHITFEKNRGVVAARNAGIQDSVFEWINLRLFFFISFFSFSVKIILTLGTFLEMAL